MHRRTLLLLALAAVGTVGSGCRYCGPRPFSRPFFHGRFASPAVAGPVSHDYAGAPVSEFGGGPIGGPVGSFGGATCCGGGASAAQSVGVVPQPIYQLGNYHPSASGLSEPLGQPTILPPGSGTGPKVEIVPQPMPKTKN